MNRHLSRIVTMQSLYEIDFRETSDLNEVLSRNIAEYEGKVDGDFVESMVKKIFKDTKKLDDLIGKSAPEWPIDQIALIDKAILRLATYELTQSKDVPPKVAINEAVELAKQFGGENSSKFINGVLGTIYDQVEKESAKKESVKTVSKDTSNKPVSKESRDKEKEK